MYVPQALYWAGLTANQPFNTGVQRVTRCLGAALQKRGVRLTPVKWNDATQAVEILTQAEADHLAKWDGPKLRPLPKLHSFLHDEWLILPEITFPVVPTGANVALWAKSQGMKVAAVFYDMIPLKTPEVYDQNTLDTLAGYWTTFASVDLALPISHTVAPDLENWLTERKLHVPPMRPCLLSGEIPGMARATEVVPPAPGPIRLLAIGTWEPRKNYPRILRALGMARQETGVDIRITIAGRQAENEFPALHAEMRSLAASLGPGVVDLKAQVTDAEMRELTAASTAMIFGSWVEGFGLPVLESLWQGRPCICHNGSALAEVAPGGGTLMVDMLNERAIADAIARLAQDPKLSPELRKEAVARPLRTWQDYGDEVLSAVSEVGWHAAPPAPPPSLPRRVMSSIWAALR